MKRYTELNYYLLLVMGIGAILCAGVVGWCINVYELVTYTGGIDVEFVLRVIGLFVAPLGAIMGLFV